MTFLDIVKDKSIEIPLIQRDYVLGKNEKKAKAFLNAIKEAMNGSGLNMDFVYGNSEDKDKNEDNKVNRFIPIDGQQRLTTLFLIYYYLSLENRYISNLTKFSYAVRPSSKDFIKALTDEESWKKLTQINIKEDIKNSSWYFLSWESDLTVQSIINMLGFIEEIFKGEDVNKLEKIQFQFLDLDKYSLGEDLYIKMNARGKQLTDFENFKSKFEKFIEDPKIRAKLDNDWLDIFWGLEKDNLKNAETEEEKREILKSIDDKYLKFFENITLFFSYKKLRKIDELNIFEFKYTKFHINIIEKILDYLTKYKEEEKDIRKDLNIFQNILNKDTLYSDRLRFYALVLFFIRVGEPRINRAKFKSFMRVSINLISNIEDSFENLKSMTKILYRLSQYLKDDDFYKKLSTSNISTSKQFKEEKKKARLILDNQNWEEEFIEAEKHWYLYGQIGFLIEYAKDNFNDFKKYRDKFMSLWDFAKKDKDNQILIYRALLTFGDYLPKIYNDNNKTFCSFNKLLREKNENWRKVFNDNQKSIFLKKLLDSFDKDNISKSLKKIIKNWLNEYNCNIASKEKRYLYILISNKKQIEYSRHLHIRFYSYDEIYFLTKTRMNGLHNELYTYSFYIKYLKKRKDLLFENIYYKEQSSWNNPCIVLENKDYDLNIEYKKEIGFKVIFSTNEKNKLSEQINNLLKENGFFQNEECYTGEICFYYNSVFSLCQMEELFQFIQILSDKFTNIGDIKQ